MEIATRRLHSQHLAGPPFDKPEDAVQWLCAVQAQDYAGAKWAIAQRTTGVTDADVDRVFNDGAILRTHVMRPTWHFVMPADIRWMLELTGPRVHAANAYQYRKLELDDAVFARSNQLLAEALSGGRHRTRKELAAVLRDGGIEASGLRLAYLLMRAELDAVVCSGPLHGKQFTYALLDERAPRGRTLEREEALAELALRYFTSHGPATVQDYAWWSGLTVADAKAGLETVRSRLVQETVDGRSYWFAEPTIPAEVEDPTVHLLPNYDEHVIAYKNHTPSIDPRVRSVLAADNDAVMAHIVILNGLVIGGWRRTVGKSDVVIRMKLLLELNEARQAALRAAAEAYGRFLGLPVTLS